MRNPRLRRFGFFVSPALLLLIAADRPNPAKLNDPSLREVMTRHYDIHTDLDESLVKDLSSRMDVMYDQYARTFSDFKLPANSPPLAVYLFETHEKYMAFTDYSGINTGGLFVAGRHPYLTAYEQGQGRDALRRTLQHEAFHQFAHAAIAGHLPPWMNEGMAQCFEESIWVGKDFLTGQIPERRLRQLQLDLNQKRLIDFNQFMSLSPRDWSNTLHTNLQKATTCYNQAWAMACFCSTDDDYHAKFLKLLQKLHANDGYPDDATRQCFPDLKDFRKKFDAWGASVKPTPEATMQEHQDTLGDFLLAIQQNKLPIPTDMTAFRDLAVKYNLKIQYTRGGVSYSTADRPIIYFEDSTGTLYTPDNLYFDPSPDAPMPDIVCKTAKLTYRTHFYTAAGKPEHEQLVTPTEN
jgi:hypothetical protein